VLETVLQTNKSQNMTW